MIKQIAEKLKILRLSAMADYLPQAIETAKRKNHSIVETLEQLIEYELEEKRQKKMISCFKKSKLLQKYTIDQFDFELHGSRKKQKALIQNLITLEFLNDNRDIIFIGNPGVGKTLLSKCIAYAATQATKKVLFTTAMDMINHLIAAEADHSLLKKLQNYQSPDLLIIDEIGYLSLGTQGSNLFFQVISGRHEKKSTMITTNLPFANWGNVFDSTTVATAIADRLVSDSEVIILEGESYRKRCKKK